LDWRADEFHRPSRNFRQHGSGIRLLKANVIDWQLMAGPKLAPSIGGMDRERYLLSFCSWPYNSFFLEYWSILFTFILLTSSIVVR
jgi:hypothetical protein